MNAIPVHVLSDARAVLIDNSKTLLDDAIHLIIDKRAARGIALAVLAREEMGKLAIVIRTHYLLKEGQYIDWERFKKRTRDHAEKLKISAFVEAIRSNNLSGVAEPEKALIRLASQREMRQWLEDQKQDGFHVRISHAGVKAPSDIIELSQAEAVYNRTRRLWHFFESNDRYNPETTFFAGIQDLYGKTIALADDLCEHPELVKLPR
jgi:AbiV family abortive infection protein